MTMGWRGIRIWRGEAELFVGWFSRKPRWAGRMSLEERLVALSECGIRMNPGLSVKESLVSFDRDEFEADGLLVLTMLGSEVECEPEGRFCDSLWHFDTECIEDHGAYAAIAERMRLLAGRDLPITDIADYVNLEENRAWLSFRIGGAMTKWDARVQDDWVDPTILSRFAALLRGRDTGRAYTYLDLGGQDCLIGCASESQRRALREATGLKWEWLE